MHRLSSLFFVLLVAVAALFSTPCVKAQDPSVIKKDIASLSVVTNELQTLCAKINFSNAPVLSPTVVVALGNVAGSVTEITAQITVNHSEPFDDAMALEIVKLLNKFLSIFDHLCVTLISKHDILTSFKVEIRNALLKLEGDLDTLFSMLIKIIPTRKDDCHRIVSSLGVTLRKVIVAYT